MADIPPSPIFGENSSIQHMGTFYCSYGTKGDYRNLLFARGPGLPQIVRPGPTGISHGTPHSPVCNLQNQDFFIFFFFPY